MKYAMWGTGILILAVLLVLAYYGLFTSVVIEEKEAGGFVLVYEMHRGPYREAAGIIERISASLLGEYNIAARRGFGLYYDDPRTVSKEELRCIAGCILEGIDERRIAYIGKRYKTAQYPKTKSVTAVFPYRGQLSILLGIVKVYPNLGDYMVQQGYSRVPIMEIYDNAGQHINYVASLSLTSEMYNELLK